jgi:hypothetical protein
MELQIFVCLNRHPKNPNLKFLKKMLRVGRIRYRVSIFSGCPAQQPHF